MTAPIPVSASPAERIRAASRRWTEPELVDRCAALLRGGPADDPELLAYLGGRGAQPLLDLDALVYWPAVWAARALLYAWHPTAASAVVAALGHDAWRVREMCAKVCALRELGEAADPLAAALADPVPRVRAAAARGLGVVGEAEHAGPLRKALTDTDPEVRRRADQALARLSDRLDRPL
ncbi:HEAT repeat domain-containing protein [Longispora fulva]|uniref:HEAT repeat protein n=1 Tax=Longispora fulva TaxID=619741 RepID=A0A8J7G8S4_9ACTN|nr:HEAT repeat domain-containing protein [Longispora fulva]MBG6135040.1 HEAT repeat protein [Longispora fulva]